MKTKHWLHHLSIACIAALIVAACSPSDDIGPENENVNPVLMAVDWNNRADGLYREADARADFRNLTSWNNRISIENNAMAVTLLANELTGRGGIVTLTNIPQREEYKLTFDVMFPADFEWGKGGKVGFGLYLGDGNTGCDRADDGNGGSARMMWYTSANGDTRFKPYLYYNDMPGTCGDNLVSSSAYPSSGSLQKEKWYTVTIQVKSNTGSNKDGHVRFAVDGTTILDENIRWTTNDSKRLINRLSFATFRGGSDASWMVDQNTRILFDNLKLERVD